MNKQLTLREAVMLLGIDADTSKRIVNIPCPICGHGKQKKLNINFDKFGKDDGAYRCAKCGTSGNAIKFWALYRQIPDLSEAAKDYNRFIKNNDRTVPYTKVAPQVVELSLAPIETRNRTYNALLDMLMLTDDHMNNLTKRGLSNVDIKKYRFKSYPSMGFENIAAKLLSNGFLLEGVPGFYKNKEKWSLVWHPSGFLIPQVDFDGNIQSFQIRHDHGEMKYMYISSIDKDHGTQANSFCNITKGIKGFKDVILTEGALKADIISSLTGYTVISIPGVNAVSFLPELLEKLKLVGMEKISIAFDMDYKTNKYVDAALLNVKRILLNEEIPYTTLVWDPKLKGLDDYLVKMKGKN